VHTSQAGNSAMQVSVLAKGKVQDHAPAVSRTPSDSLVLTSLESSEAVTEPQLSQFS